MDWSIMFLDILDFNSVRMLTVERRWDIGVRGAGESSSELNRLKILLIWFSCFSNRIYIPHNWRVLGQNPKIDKLKMIYETIIHFECL